MKRIVLIFSLIFLLVPFSGIAQIEEVFNVERLKQRHKEGLGIKGFTSTRSNIFYSASMSGEPITDIPAFGQLLILDYYEGTFGVLKDTLYGFIAGEKIISDFKVDSYKSIWENKIKELVREAEIRKRRMEREKSWESSFAETSYGSDKVSLEKNLYNPFAKLKYSEIIVYNFNLRNESPSSVFRNGKLTDRIEFPGSELNDDQIDDLFKILNDTSTYGKKPQKLFNPKIGIVLSQGEKNVGFIDVDLDNSRIKSSVYLPAMNYHNYSISSPKGDSVIEMTGLSRQGKEQLLDYFRKMKLYVSGYPKTIIFGVDMTSSVTGYFDSIPKVCPAFHVSYGRNSLSFGPKFWIGKFYGGEQTTWAGSVQLTYRHFITRYGRLVGVNVFYDLDYGFHKHRESIIAPADIRRLVRTQTFMNHAIGIGTRVKIYRNLFLAADIGVGKGFSSNKLVYTDVKFPANNYEIPQGFFKGVFFDPGINFKIGFFWHIARQ